MRNYILKRIPESRIATFDVYAVGQSKHHIPVLLECDITVPREKIKKLKSSGEKVSFNAWLLKVISTAIMQFPEAGAFLYNRKNLIIFDDVNISLLVEKNIEGNKVPLPLVISGANKKTISAITTEIRNAKLKTLSAGEKVINQKTNRFEGLYYRLPGFIRRSVWRYFSRNPKAAYSHMGNVAVTSLGTMGSINGWFVHRSIHPISFGIGSITKKPAVVGDEILIREILNITVLIDHDVIDGAPMARFVKYLVDGIQAGKELW